MAITVERVRRALEQLAAERPDHRDPRPAQGQPPRYVTNGEPACLVAHVLHRLGMSVGALRELDREPGRFGAGVRIRDSRHPALRVMSRPALDLLAYVQFVQDAGFAWGAAVEDAFAEQHRYGRFTRTWV
ncbi:hypothetical protein [Micromonospora maritima]|uniref:hypothetical protein n=1 Tax=Micromonospora maritima TaxID=986711 RepID=UPI00157D710F|nr:hypothetical protein [Micromonospora maritima]